MQIFPWSKKYQIRIWQTSVYYNELLVYRPNIYSLTGSHLPNITRLSNIPGLQLCVF